MQIKNIYKELENAALDSKVGIRRIALIDEKELGYHTAEIANEVGAHVHKDGYEIYHILEGEGEMHLGEVEFEGDTPISVTWKAPAKVTKGDVLYVPPGTAHCLKNKGENPIIIAFVCHPKNLISDRHLVNQPE